MVKKFRQDKNWTQAQFADAINDVLEKNPGLKKVTSRNPTGLIDQQTAQRLESGKISLDKKWLTVLGIVFDKTPNEILGIGSDDNHPKDKIDIALDKIISGLEAEKKKTLLQLAKALKNNDEDIDED